MIPYYRSRSPMLDDRYDVIFRNSGQCLKCSDHVVSENGWSFVYCSCRNIMLDGGNVYIRRIINHHNNEEDGFHDTSVTLQNIDWFRFWRVS